MLRTEDGVIVIVLLGIGGVLSAYQLWFGTAAFIGVGIMYLFACGTGAPVEAHKQ
jgi:hypothetical protein